MTAPPDVVALIGPPAAGKSTLTQHWNGGHRSLFRLRDHVRAQAQDDAALRAQIEAATDPLGWLPDAVVCPLVEAALTALREPSGPSARLVLENYPGTPAQANHLLRLLPQHLALVELVVSTETVRRRAAGRRVCATCEPASGNDPHRPVPAASATGTCPICDHPLQSRPSDTPPVLAQRLQRYQRYSPAIRSAFSKPAFPCTASTPRPPQQPSPSRCTPPLPGAPSSP